MNTQNTNLKVLVVDDDQGSLLFIEHVLTTDGYTVITAEGGDSALKLMNQSLPDLLITDIVMENGEGTALIMNVRKMSDLPILAISGGNIGFGADYLDMALNFGANAVLSKPFYKSELLDKIDELLNISEEKKPAIAGFILRHLTALLLPLFLFNLLLNYGYNTTVF